MTDLETRLRRGLAGEPARLSTHDLLEGVRRDARRRRARRTTVVGAVAALVLVAAAGVGVHHRRVQVAAQESDLSPSGTTAVSVTSSGEIFKAVASQGCTMPCSTIWKKVDGQWAKLATFRSDGPPVELVIRHLAMAPDGRNGWAWGEHLFATHDGGSTWSRITTGPAALPYGVFDVQVGRTDAWVSGSRNTGGDTLWRVPLGSDRWIPVETPRVSGPWGTDVPARHWFVVDVLPDGRVALSLQHVYLGNEYGWTEEPRVSCRRTGVLLGGTIPPQSICGPVGRELNWGSSPEGYSRFQVGLNPTSASDPVGQPDMLFVSGDRASIDTPTGVVHSDLRLGADDAVVDWSQSGAHVVILTDGHRIFLSDDHGRTWRQET